MTTNKPHPPSKQDALPGCDKQADSQKPHCPGSICPNCGKGKLDYNGLLELECPICGYRDTGGALGT